MAQLIIWSAGDNDWRDCPPDEITWLDRRLLSAGQDDTLHRSPRCAGLRYVNYRWELFSRDTTHKIYLARPDPVSPVNYQAVQRAPQHILPMAPAHFESLPVPLDDGPWLVSVGKWVVPFRVGAAVDGQDERAVLRPDEQPPTREDEVRAATAVAAGGKGSPPKPDAVPKVAAYLERNVQARMAMAYYYQDFLLGTVAPQVMPMIDVAVALDLVAESAISEYKKELQRRIWNRQGHQRELAEFLIANGLITRADLATARATATANEHSGRTEMARQRLRYRQRR